MAAGSIKLQSNDTRIATVTFEDGAAGNVLVVVPKEGGVLASEGYAIAKSGDETKEGVLTFSSSPIVPTPTNGDNSTKVATTAFVNSEISGDVGIANSPLVKTALNASGTAPIYACRAWVNFNGTGTVAIRASGNVSSITDNGVGDYTVNFTTAMSDANYSVNLTTLALSGVNHDFTAHIAGVAMSGPTTMTTIALRISTGNITSAAAWDGFTICASIFI